MTVKIETRAYRPCDLCDKQATHLLEVNVEQCLSQIEALERRLFKKSLLSLIILLTRGRRIYLCDTHYDFLKNIHHLHERCREVGLHPFLRRIKV